MEQDERIIAAKREMRKGFYQGIAQWVQQGFIDHQPTQRPDGSPLTETDQIMGAYLRSLAGDLIADLQQRAQEGNA